MGFYYGSSGSQPPEQKPGGIKEALQITWVVFQVLALPLAILLGGVAYLVLLFYLFAWTPLAGLAGLSVIIIAIAGRAVWEWKHPPTLE